MNGYRAASAVVEDGATIGDGTTIWDLSQVRSTATVGRDCTIGRNVYVDGDVVLGDRCKVQNNALLYGPARLGDGVFVGPATVFTNDRHPRAVNPDLSLKRIDDWESAGVDIATGATIGAGAVVLGGVRIGAWALVAAHATVTREVAPFALVIGSPAQRIAWVGRTGHRLVPEGSGRWRCTDTDRVYHETEAGLDEDAS